jgi:regulator of sigma E protease
MHRFRFTGLALAPAAVLAAASMDDSAGMAKAIVMIGVLIFLHELGHFIFAKRMGLPVETFSLGFGPRVFGFKWRETDMRLSALPLGGYVKLAGYNPEDPDAEDPHGFLKQPFHRRMLFYSGGILANILTAFLVLSAVGVDSARITSAQPEPSPLVVLRVEPGMPAAQAGLQTGDLIRRFGDLTFPSAKSDEAVAYIQARAGKPIPVLVERAGKPETVQVTPADMGGKGKLGIVFSPTKMTYQRRALQAGDFLRGPWLGVQDTALLTWQVLEGFGRLVSFHASVREIGGPIAIVKGGSEAAKAGWAGFCMFMAFISLNLAVLNALPIPFLDGGHMAMLVFEKLRGKDLTVQLKERILAGGFFFLITLMAFVIALDLWRLKQ